MILSSTKMDALMELFSTKIPNSQADLADLMTVYVARLYPQITEIMDEPLELECAGPAGPRPWMCPVVQELCASCGEPICLKE